MGRWSVPNKGYDFDDDLMVKNGFIFAGVNYIKGLKKDEDMLLKALYKNDQSLDSYMIRQYKREINNITNRHLEHNRLMREYIQDNEPAIVSLFETLKDHDDNIARLAEFYLFNAALGRELDRLIRYISYTPISKKGFIQLYHNIYHEIKRAIEWYYGKDESKVTKWKFYTNQNYIGEHIEFLTIKHKFVKINIAEKPIRGAAALITELLTNKKPDIKKEIPQDNFHYIL